MTIYYIINGRIPTEKANGYQISQMCQAFAENGEKVFLLRPNRKLSSKHEEYKNNLKDFYNLREDIAAVDVWSFDFQHYANKICSWLDHIQFITNLMHTASYVFGLFVFFFLRKKKTKELIYVRDVNLLSWLFVFLDKQLKNNIVLELHYLPEGKAKRRRYAKIFKHAKLVICITEKMRQDVISLGVEAEKTWVEHDGVDLQTFEIDLDQVACRRLFGYPENELIIGYVGNFHTNGQEKGIDALISAAAIVLQNKPQVHFYFVGGPMDLVPKYLKLIDQLQLPNDHFHFYDRRPVSQVPASMAACDVLVIPLPWNPYFAYYMSPMKLFEYMASKRCIVATDVESLCEILSNGKNALLAKHSDTQSLAENILLALNQPLLREKLAGNAYQDVQFHSWYLRAKRILNFISSLSSGVKS